MSNLLQIKAQSSVGIINRQFLNGINLQSIFSAEYKALYSTPDVLYQNPSPTFGFRQPYVWTSPGDSEFNKFIKRFDSRYLPLGSVIQDTERLSKFTASSKGLFWLLKEQALHLQNPFDETNIVDPSSHLISAIRPASLGLIPRVTKHISSASPIGAAIGLITGNNLGGPTSTVGNDALPTSEGNIGATGLLRGNTATSAYNRLQTKLGNAGIGSGGLLSRILKNIAPSVNAKQPWSAEYRADELTYDTLVKNYEGGSYVTETAIPSLEQKFGYRWRSSYLSSENLYTEETYIDKQTKSDSGTSRIREIWEESIKGNSLKSSEIQPVTADNERFVNSLKSQNTANSVQASNGDIFGGGMADSLAPNVYGHKDFSTFYSGGGETVKAYYESGRSKISKKDISSESREKKLGFGDYGLNKKDAGKSHINRRDKLNTLGVLDNLAKVGGMQSTTDIIPFVFFDIINKNYVVFRATLKSVSDNFNAEWSDFKYLGRADRLYLYGGHKRDISFNFRVYATSKIEMYSMWNRVNYFTGFTEPSSITNAGNIAQPYRINTPPLVNMTIGDIYYQQPIIISTIGVSIPEEASWEIDDGLMYPMLVEISVSATILNRSPSRIHRNRFGKQCKNETNIASGNIEPELGSQNSLFSDEDGNYIFNPDGIIKLTST